MSMELALIPISVEQARHHATVAQVGPFMVLLDCGWSEDLNPADMEPLNDYLDHIDIVLLSKGSIKHLAGYPYIHHKLKPECIVLCTEPVRYLGELICLSLVEEIEKYKNVEALDTDNILKAFMNQRVQTLKYTESFELSSSVADKGVNTKLTVTPYQAGGSLGASYWIIQLDGSQMVYCSDFNLRDTRHVGGMDFRRLMDPPDLRMPSVMVMSLAPVRSDVPQIGYTRTPVSENLSSTAGTSSRVCLTCGESYFLDKTIEVLRDGGSVVVPMDMTGSVFDVMLLLDEAWSSDGSLTDKYPICWVSCYGDIFLDQIKTRLEFMSKRVQRLFEERPDKKNPFVMQNIRMYASLSDMHMHILPRQPKIIIATFPSLSTGDTRELLFETAREPRNLLWLTLPWYPEGSLAAQIFEDFVINKSAEKEYQVTQYLRRPMAETQLRAYYDEKMEEEDRLKNKNKRKKKPLNTIQEENTETAWKNKIGKQSDTVLEHPKAAETFFEPPGWQTKSITHVEHRKDVDDYGQLLTEQEIELWQTASEQQQEGALPAAPKPKETKKKGYGRRGDNQSGPKPLEETSKDMDWLHNLRVRFGEPMRSEVRKKTLIIACKVLYFEFDAHDHRDTRALLLKTNPKQVIVLPTAVNCEFESLQALNSTIHFLREALTVNWRPEKRKLKFSKLLWDKLAFQKLEDGSKICTVIAVPGPEEDSLEPAEDKDEHLRDTLLMSVPRLTDLRLVMQKAVPDSILTFQEAQNTRLLDINEKVRIGLKNSVVKLEGSVSDEFYKARELLYEKSVGV